MKPPHTATREPISQPRCLRLHADDNVAVVLEGLAPGPVAITGSEEGATITALEPIACGHKIALRPIHESGLLRKYGVAIGAATRPIQAGEWVHTHNCRSGLDERSHTLDRHTGASTDIRYV